MLISCACPYCAEPVEETRASQLYWTAITDRQPECACWPWLERGRKHVRASKRCSTPSTTAEGRREHRSGPTKTRQGRDGQCSGSKALLGGGSRVSAGRRQQWKSWRAARVSVKNPHDDRGSGHKARGNAAGATACPGGESRYTRHGSR